MAPPAAPRRVPFFRTLGLIALGCAAILGLAPRRLTFTVLGLSVAAVFLALLVRDQWRRHRLVLAEDDGSLPPIALILVGGLGAPVLVVLFISAFLSVDFAKPPLERACLCTRVGGLVTAGLYGFVLVFLAGALAGMVTLFVGMVARVRFEYRRRRPRPGDHAPTLQRLPPP